MKYVPSVSPAKISGLWDGLSITPSAGIKAAQPVQQRTLPPLVELSHKHIDPQTPEEPKERRHNPLTHGERRVYCRRAKHLAVRIELRSGVERRHNKQRLDDQSEHIDIEA